MVRLVGERSRMPRQDGDTGTVGVGLVLQHLDVESALMRGVATR